MHTNWSPVISKFSDNILFRQSKRYFVNLKIKQRNFHWKTSKCLSKGFTVIRDYFRIFVINIYLHISRWQSAWWLLVCEYLVEPCSNSSSGIQTYIAYSFTMILTVIQCKILWYILPIFWWVGVGGWYILMPECDFLIYT